MCSDQAVAIEVRLQEEFSESRGELLQRGGLLGCEDQPMVDQLLQLQRGQHVVVVGIDAVQQHLVLQLWEEVLFLCYLLFSVWSPPYTAATLAHSHAHKCLMPHAFFRGSRPPASHAASPTPLWCCGCGVCIVGCRGMCCRVRVRECR